MRIFLSVAAAGTAVSLIAKALADAYLVERVSVMGQFLGLQKSFNPGIAFGLRLPSGIQEALIIVALIVVVIFAWKTARTRTSQAGFGLIAGGALGNILDRARDGLVTDFFQVGAFPIFNVADACISVGVAFLLAEAFILNRRIRN